MLGGGARRLLLRQHRQRHRCRLLALLALPIGKWGGRIRRKSGAASMLTRVVQQHLFPLTAMQALTTGRLDGQNQRSNGVVSMVAEAVLRSLRQLLARRRTATLDS